MEQSLVVPCRPILKYLASLVGSYCLLVVFVSSVPSISHHFTDLVTTGAAFALSNLGFVAEVYSQATHVGYSEIHFNSTVYRVNEDCTGLSLVLLVAAAIVAIPAPLRIRIWGVVLMSFLAAFIGCMRIVVLGCVAEYQADLFHLFHTYLMEVATVGAMLWIFTGWGNFTSPYRRLSAS